KTPWAMRSKSFCARRLRRAASTPGARRRDRCLRLLQQRPRGERRGYRLPRRARLPGQNANELPQRLARRKRRRRLPRKLHRLQQTTGPPRFPPKKFAVTKKNPRGFLKFPDPALGRREEIPVYCT